MKPEVVFTVSNAQAELLKPLIDKMLNNERGGMVMGNVVRKREVINGEPFVEAAFRFIDYDTAEMLIDIVNSRKTEIENA